MADDAETAIAFLRSTNPTSSCLISISPMEAPDFRCRAAERPWRSMPLREREGASLPDARPCDWMPDEAIHGRGCAPLARRGPGRLRAAARLTDRRSSRT
jgi:hypothetical protein